jgi:hypothetical protein
LFTLRDALLRAIRCALGAECQEDGYRPHVGIAYCNSPVPATPLVKAIEPLRALPPADVNVGSVELVCLRRERRTYTWDTVTSLTLRESGDV